MRHVPPQRTAADPNPRADQHSAPLGVDLVRESSVPSRPADGAGAVRHPMGAERIE